MLLEYFLFFTQFSFLYFFYVNIYNDIKLCVTNNVGTTFKYIYIIQQILKKVVNQKIFEQVYKIFDMVHEKQIIIFNSQVKQRNYLIRH